MTSAAGTIGTSWMSTAAGATVEKTAIFSRETIYMQQQELITRKLATAAETIGTSQTTTAYGRPAISGIPEIVASAVTPTAQDRS